MTAAATEARPALIAAMESPRFYPHAPAAVERRETHVSWAMLAGDLVYKVHKPVRLAFVDARALERRRELCQAEVALNRRLAPRLYLGVRAIVRRDGGGYALADAESATDAVEYAVEMRRFDEERTLARLLGRGAVPAGAIAEVGERLARFHAEAERVGAWSDVVPALRRAIDDNLQTLSELGAAAFDVGDFASAARFVSAFLAARGEQLVDRARRGRARDGHGDLRAEHVVLEAGVEVVDCLEFDPALRRIDGGCDLAFLTMDLIDRGAEDLAHELVAAYRGAGGDPGDDALLAFFAAYRALVRAKVALVRADQLFATNPERAELRAAAARLLALARRLAWRARGPLVLALGGVPGTGKSHLAAALAGTSGLPVVDADTTRKRLAGLAPTERAGAAAYTAAFNRRTYDELGRRAARAAAARGGVVVDATFRFAADRRAFLAAAGVGPAVVLVECTAPAAVVAERAAARERDPERISDATAEIAAREAARWELPDELPPDRHLRVRTDRPVDEVVGEIEALLDHRLACVRPVAA